MFKCMPFRSAKFERPVWSRHTQKMFFKLLYRTEMFLNLVSSSPRPSTISVHCVYDLYITHDRQSRLSTIKTTASVSDCSHKLRYHIYRVVILSLQHSNNYSLTEKTAQLIGPTPLSKLKVQVVSNWWIFRFLQERITCVKNHFLYQLKTAVLPIFCSNVWRKLILIFKKIWCLLHNE